MTKVISASIDEKRRVTYPLEYHPKSLTEGQIAIKIIAHPLPGSSGQVYAVIPTVVNLLPQLVGASGRKIKASSIVPPNTVPIPDYYKQQLPPGFPENKLRNAVRVLDKQNRFVIPKEFFPRVKNHDQKCEFHLIGDTPYLLLAPNSKARKRDLELLSPQVAKPAKKPAVERLVRTVPLIKRAYFPKAPADAEAYLRGLRIGTPLHEKNKLFSRHRRLQK